MEEKQLYTANAKFSALSGLMFFAPFVKYGIKSNPELSDNEKVYINGYCKVGFVNLAILLIYLTMLLLDLLGYSFSLLSSIEIFLSYVLYIILLVSMILCVNDAVLRLPGESIRQNIQHKGQIFKSFIPFENFSLRYKCPDYSMPYWRLKESIFWRVLFIYISLLIGNEAGMVVVGIIFIRLMLLLINIDIIPLGIKKSLNRLFVCNPEEVMALISTKIIVKIKKSDYNETLQTQKLKYIEGQKFGLSIIIQYLLFIGLLVWMYYKTFLNRQTQIILYIGIFVWFMRVILFYKNKKAFIGIPVLSELLSIVIK